MQAEKKTRLKENQHIIVQEVLDSASKCDAKADFQKSSDISAEFLADNSTFLPKKSNNVTM